MAEELKAAPASKERDKVTKEELKQIVERLAQDKCDGLKGSILKLKILSICTFEISVFLVIAFERMYVKGHIGIVDVSVLAALIFAIGYCCFKRICRSMDRMRKIRNDITAGLRRGVVVTQQMLDDYNRGEPVSVNIGRSGSVMVDAR